MNPNYNFTGEEFTEENWRELPDELPPFTTESAIATGADFEFDLTYRSIRGELNENYCSYGGDQMADRNPLSETLLDQKSRTQEIQSPSFQIKQQESPLSLPDFDLKAPAVPFYLGFSHFSLKLSLNELVARVSNCLEKIIELDYSFLENLCKWDIVYLRGSSFCHFEISVFDEKETLKKYLVEGNRLSGDSLSFRLVFNQIKEALTAPKSRQFSSSVSPYLQLPVPSLSSSLPQAPKFPNCSLNLPDELSRSHTEGNLIDEDEYIRENLVPILAMIEPKAPIDVQLEGIRILCDFTMSIDLHRLLVECHCVEKLIGLLTSKMAIGDADDQCVEETRCHQNALYAIANMSTFRPCQNILVSSDQFLAYLMSHITNGTHVTAEMRRECARTLANLCVGLAPKIVRNLGLPVTMKWVATVDSLSDERLKIHATRAKMYIQNCF